MERQPTCHFVQVTLDALRLKREAWGASAPHAFFIYKIFTNYGLTKNDLYLKLSTQSFIMQKLYAQNRGFHSTIRNNERK